MSIDWKSVIASVAPTIATMLGGPLAGVAVKTIGDKLLGNPAATPADVEQAMATASPDTLIKLKQIDADLQKQLSDNGIKIDEMSEADVANARAREIAIRDRTPERLAWTTILGFIGMSAGIIAALFYEPDKADKLLTGSAGLFLGTVFGYLANDAKQAAAYYFGSSIGSKDKDATLAEIAKS